MLKSTLIERLTDKLKQVNIGDIEHSVNLIINAMSESLSSGDRIEIRDFGSFTLHYRAPRNAHNPKTGKRLVTAPKYRPHFKPGKALRERVNSNNKNVAG